MEDCLIKYIDFVNLEYTPIETDIICSFYIESNAIGITEASGAVAAESSIGTWTEINTMKRYVKRLSAKVFEIDGNNIKIAYPVELFEENNMPNILSSLAGNIFGLADIKNLRLNDIYFPEIIVTSFKGPKYGVNGIRKLMGVNDRPFIGTIIKPKLGLKTRDHADIAFQAWIGGCDFVKDDENLSNQSFNKFSDRLNLTLRKRDQAEKETGDKKMYLINVTSDSEEMIRRARMVQDFGGEYVMIDVLSCGYSSLQTLRDQDLDIILHAHRAGHASFTRNPKHGVSMKVISRIIRMIGFDQLHVGTAVGKMSESRADVLTNVDTLREHLFGLKEVLPIASGGLHPKNVPSLVSIFGIDFVIQAGGGIHGHLKGTLSGAKAMRQAVDATMKGIPLDEYAEKFVELKSVLQLWK